MEPKGDVGMEEGRLQLVFCCNTDRTRLGVGLGGNWGVVRIFH